MEWTEMRSIKLALLEQKRATPLIGERPVNAKLTASELCCFGNELSCLLLPGATLFSQEALANGGV